MGVVIVVPAFTEGEQGNEPVVGGDIASEEAARSPCVSGGMDQPSGVQADYRAHEQSPHQERKTADCEKQNSRQNHGNVMVFRDPDMKLGFCKIRYIAG